MMNETKGANYIQQPACQTWVRLSLIAILCILGIHAGSQSAFAGPPVIFTLSDQATGAEIQKALDSLPANGEVRLKPGTYEISEPLMLRHDGVTLRGSGPSTILHLVNGADCPVVILGPPIAAKHHIARHLRLADLMIDGNRKNQKSENSIDGAHRSRSKALNERSSQTEQEVDDQPQEDDSDHHPHVRKKMIRVRS